MYFARITFLLVLFSFFLSPASAQERWEYIYEGQTYDSLVEAEAALKSSPEFIDVWRSGGTVLARWSNGLVTLLIVLVVN